MKFILVCSNDFVCLNRRRFNSWPDICLIKRIGKDRVTIFFMSQFEVNTHSIWISLDIIVFSNKFLAFFFEGMHYNNQQQHHYQSLLSFISRTLKKRALTHKLHYKLLQQRFGD